MYSAPQLEAGDGTPFWRRCVLGACMFLSVAAFGFLEPFVPLYLELSGLQRSQIGLVSGLGAGLALLIQPLLGRLSDRIDARRPLMLAAALVAGCAYLSYRWVNGLVPFILLTAIGINGVMYLNTANAVLVGRMANRDGNLKQGGGTFAAYRVWGSVGYVVVSLLAGLLLIRTPGGPAGMSRETIGQIFLYGPMLFFLVALVVCLLPDPKKEEIAACREQAGVEDEEGSTQRGCDRNLRRFLRAYFLYIFAYTGSAAYLSLYLKSLGAAPIWITAVFAGGVLCEVIVMSQVGRLSDRFGRRPLLAVSFIVMPLRLLLYIPATGPLWVLCVQTLHGINFGIMVAVAVAFINDLCTEEGRGAAQAKLAAASGIAAACGPVAGGWISQHVGIGWNFGFMALAAAGGAGMFLWKVKESHPQPVRLHRVGPDYLRPVLRVLCVPASWLSRGARFRRGGD